MADNNVSIFMRARLGSSRLPKKHLLYIKGKPVIQHLIERVRDNTNVKYIILCTTDESEDDELEKIALECGIKCFRGDANNVLKRYYDAGKKYNVKYIVNIDCDDILLDYELIDKTANLMEILNADYLTWEGYPLGCIPTGMSFSGIKKLFETTDENIEHISLYFTNSNEFTTANIQLSNKLLNRDYMAELRLTLDYEDDFKLFEQIYNELYDADQYISFTNLIKLIDENKYLIKINSHLNEDYFNGYDDFMKDKFESD